MNVCALGCGFVHFVLMLSFDVAFGLEQYPFAAQLICGEYRVKRM